MSEEVEGRTVCPPPHAQHMDEAVKVDSKKENQGSRVIKSLEEESHCIERR